MEAEKNEPSFDIVFKLQKKVVFIKVSVETFYVLIYFEVN